jgi:hypothetical protein
LIELDINDNQKIYFVLLRKNDPPDFILNGTKELLDLFADVEEHPFVPDQRNDMEFWKQSIHSKNSKLADILRTQPLNI